MGLIKITNRNLHDIAWQNASNCKFEINNQIDVWRINISSNFYLLDDFLLIMNAGEIARANRYFHIKDKNRFIVSRGALRNILGKYLQLLPVFVEFEIGFNKKPFIKNHPDLYYNISHSGDWIILAVASSDIGADVEYINPDFNFNDILTDNFSADEVDYIAQKTSTEHFYKLWTRKEALTKATGKGLDDQLKFIPCLDGIHFSQSEIINSKSNWTINSFKINEHNVAAVAHNYLTEEISFWEGGSVFN